MLDLIDRAVRIAHEPEPAPLLNHVAGEFAPAVARLWPAPHVAYFAASSARRHLVCMTLAVSGALTHEAATVALEAPLRAAIRRLLPAAPAGLARALGRMGETAWAAEDYRDLLALLAREAAAKPLRHAEAIRPDAVRRLRLAPPGVGEAVEALSALNDDAIRLVAECYGVIRDRDGSAAAEAAAARWGKAGNAKALLAAVHDDVMMEVAAPPHAGTALLRPIATKAALRKKALEYRNCLGNLVSGAVTGDSAYYEWIEPPCVVVEITRDAIYGWRLNQARLAGNRPVPKASRQRIIDELGLMGVHIGHAAWALEHALVHAALQPGFTRRRAPEDLDYLFEDIAP